ncbi:hypothetical protein [Dyadobacter sp. 3J3]|uniref:hypothetical protein n=1 Tax=Dyadobacter sp. 3J3 TaxID=2606600 RepID=UPI00135A1D6F|nr:hypothetical protein [Dyadobacter sp. 3J3]
MIQTDLCIVGAGPAGLFAVLEAGLLNMRCHVLDGSSFGYMELLENSDDESLNRILLEKIAEFNPGFSLGEVVETIDRDNDGCYVLVTNEHTIIHCKSIVMTGDSQRLHLNKNP